MTDVRIGFMSSVAPFYTVEQLVSAAQRYGFDAVELRAQWGHAFNLDLDTPKTARKEARHRFEDAGIAISSLSLSARFAQPSAEARQAAIDEVARYAELAADIGAPIMRVFGGVPPEGHTMQELRDRTGEALGKAAARCADWGVAPCLETHDVHNNPSDVAYIVTVANHPNLGVLWHPGWHLRLGIPVPEAYKLIKPWVRHCHVNEGLRPGQERPEVGPLALGSGDGHVLGVMRLLKADGFEGVMSWEWINGKQTNYNVPDLASTIDPEPYLAQHAAKLHEYRVALR